MLTGIPMSGQITSTATATTTINITLAGISPGKEFTAGELLGFVRNGVRGCTHQEDKRHSRHHQRGEKNYLRGYTQIGSNDQRDRKGDGLWPLRS